jgi:hypothetical protein
MMKKKYNIQPKEYSRKEDIINKFRPMNNNKKEYVRMLKNTNV